MYWSVHLEGGYLRFNSNYIANLPLYSVEHSDENSVENSDENSADKSSLIQAITQIGGRMISGKLSDSDFIYLKNKAEALTFLLYEVSPEDIVTIMDYMELKELVRRECIIHYAGKQN